MYTTRSATPLIQSDLRTARVDFRMTHEERELINQAAHQRGMTLTSWAIKILTWPPRWTSPGRARHAGRGCNG